MGQFVRVKIFCSASGTAAARAGAGTRAAGSTGAGAAGSAPAVVPPHAAAAGRTAAGMVIFRRVGAGVALGGRCGAGHMDGVYAVGVPEPVVRVQPAAEAAAQGDLIMILLPDEVQAAVYEKDIKPNLTPGKALLFAHGFNIHFNQIVPPKEGGAE